MHARQQVPAAVLRLATEQCGTVSRSQALGLGLNHKAVYRLLSEGHWGSIEPGIYLVPNTAPSWHTQVWAGILLGGTRSRAAGLTAAVLDGLVDSESLPIEILVPTGTRLADREWVTFRQERDTVRLPSSPAEPPRTRVEDTVLDLCARGTQADCVNWVTVAVQRRLTTPPALLRTLHRRTRMPHRKFLEGLLPEVASGVHSPLEYRYLRDVEQAHGLVKGQRQRARPNRNGFIDILYREYALIVELDGRIGHIEQGALRDMRRDNVHTRAGLRSLRFGWRDVTERPCSVALEVAELLIGLGWGGYPGRCPRC